MGYIRHDAIIVTSFNEKYLYPALNKAVELGLPVSELVESRTNGYCSFLIAPDGSKEGWDTSDHGDTARAAWKEWAHTKRHDDELYIDWVHISYAGDEAADTKIIEHHREGE